MTLEHWLLSARIDGVKSQNTTGFKHVACNPVAVEFAVSGYRVYGCKINDILITIFMSNNHFCKILT